MEYLSSLIGGAGRAGASAGVVYRRPAAGRGERKSIAPMAKRLSPDENEAEASRQRLQEAVVHRQM